jgi:FecR protein
MRTIRSFSKYLFGFGLTAAMLIGATSANSAPAVGYAAVTTVQGDAQYMYPGQDWKALTPGTTLSSGAVIKTGGGAFVYMAVNQKTSAVRLNENSVLALEKMQQLGTPEKDTDTTLDIRSGTVAGDVKKLAKASHFDIRTPNGVAGIRGTTWIITVTVNSVDVTAQVTVTCLNGQVVYVYTATTANGTSVPVTAVVNSQQTVEVTVNNQQVTPTENQQVTPTEVNPKIAQTFTKQIADLDLAVTVTATPLPDMIPGTGTGTGTGGTGTGGPDIGPGTGTGTGTGGTGTGGPDIGPGTGTGTGTGNISPTAPQ